MIISPVRLFMVRNGARLPTIEKVSGRPSGLDALTRRMLVERAAEAEILTEKLVWSMAGGKSNGRHCRFLAAVGATDSYRPTAQVVQPKHIGEPPVLKVPPGHDWHGMDGVGENEPAGQAEHVDAACSLVEPGLHALQLVTAEVSGWNVPLSHCRQVPVVFAVHEPLRYDPGPHVDTQALQAVRPPTMS
jgi:hypothetical protein